MKKRLAILACLFAVSFPVVPVWGQDSSILKDNLVAGITEEMNLVIEESISKAQIDIISKQQLDKIQEAVTKINALDTSNTKEWFKNYKEIEQEYSEWVDPDESIYDYFNSYELELLFRIVETEVRGDTYFDEKVNVASVILNRMEHDDFPESMHDVITQYPQFSSYTSGAYKNVTVTETTILACEYAFQFRDTTNGALYFDSTNGNSWADKNREFLFKDSVGHSFYR